MLVPQSDQMMALTQRWPQLLARATVLPQQHKLRLRFLCLPTPIVGGRYLQQFLRHIEQHHHLL